MADDKYRWLSVEEVASMYMLGKIGEGVQHLYSNMKSIPLANKIIFDSLLRAIIYHIDETSEDKKSAAEAAVRVLTKYLNDL